MKLHTYLYDRSSSSVKHHALIANSKLPLLLCYSFTRPILVIQLVRSEWPEFWSFLNSDHHVATMHAGDRWQFFGCASGHLTPSSSTSTNHIAAAGGGPTAASGGSGSFGSAGPGSPWMPSPHGPAPSVNGHAGAASDSLDATDALGGNQSNVFLRCLPAAAAVATGGAGLKNAFVIVQITRFQQVIGVFTLQAPTEALKVDV